MNTTGTLDWWTRLPYHIGPYLFEYKGMGIRYYSLMYIIAFFCIYLLLRYRMKTENFNITKQHIDDFIPWAAGGVLLGGRLGYVVFYDLSYFIQHPLRIFLPFNFENGFTFTGISGMSYHGGLIGVAIAVGLFCRRRKLSLLEFSDFLCPAIPFGYTFGRLGNFFNAELYGRPTHVPWAMMFPSDPTHTLRHPSQLYEALFEGLFLFALLWFIRKSEWTRHRMFGLYLAGYGIIRFFIEFVRMPDPQLNFVFYQFTMGQVLCFLMIVFGLAIVLAVKKSKPG